LASIDDPRKAPIRWLWEENIAAAHIDARDEDTVPGPAGLKGLIADPTLRWFALHRLAAVASRVSRCFSGRRSRPLAREPGKSTPPIRIIANSPTNEG
jgi:hypothetical protein